MTRFSVLIYLLSNCYHYHFIYEYLCFCLFCNSSAVYMQILLRVIEEGKINTVIQTVSA